MESKLASTPTQIQSKSNLFKKLLTIIIAVAAFGLSTNAQTIYALSGSNLISFNALVPTVVLNTVTVTGISGGQYIAGIDFRPVTGELYALGYNESNGETQLYIVNTTTGIATPRNIDPVVLQANMGKISFDFNPTVDRIRVTGSNNANYRLHPVTGAIAATDSNLVFLDADVNAGTDPSIGAGAYTNSYIGATTTSLFNYDDSLNIITLQNPPNNGKLNTIGSSGIVVNTDEPSTDMDIYYNAITSTNVAYLAANTGSGSNDNLYTIDLATGTATLVGIIGLGTAVQDIAVLIDRTLPGTINGQLVYALTGSNSMITFDSNNPATVRSQVTPSGLASGQVISGMDFRPATGELYALGYNSTNNEAQLYTIAPSTGVATAVGSTSTLMLGAGTIAFDFNPTVDRIRIMGSNDSNYRVNPVTGAIAATDLALNYATGDANEGANPAIGSAAYTNSYNGTTTTSLFGYDEALNVLALQNPPNNGTLTTIGNSGITVNVADPTVDIDVYYDFATSTNMAYLAANVGSSNFDNLYTVNTTTGTATLVGQIGNGIAIKDIAILIDSIPAITGINEIQGNKMAMRVFPNPTSGKVYLQYEVMERGLVTVLVSDLMGRTIATVEQANQPAGIHQSIWEANATPGIYLVQLYRDGQLQQVHKLMVE